MRRGRGGGGGGLAGWLRGAAKREREEKERYPGSSSSGESLLERFAVHVEMTRGPGERGRGERETWMRIILPPSLTFLMDDQGSLSGFFRSKSQETGHT